MTPYRRCHAIDGEEVATSFAHGGTYFARNTPYFKINHRRIARLFGQFRNHICLSARCQDIILITSTWRASREVSFKLTRVDINNIVYKLRSKEKFIINETSIKGTTNANNRDPSIVEVTIRIIPGPIMASE